jgi:hypothetical protein
MTASATIVPARTTRAGPHRDRLDAALDRLGGIAPAISARARTSLRAALGGLAASRLGEAAWTCSRLTPTGYPVELGVTSRRAELRWVSEVIAPEDDPAKAVHRAEAIAVAHGAIALDRGLRDAIRNGQDGRALRFGAWLGARHGERDGDVRDTWKLYAEVPRETGWQGLPFDLGPARDILGGIATPRFVGLGLDGTGRTELYARVLPGAEDAVAVAFGRSHLAAFVHPLLSRLAAFGARRPAPHNLGLSLVIGPEHEVMALSVFTFARQLFPTDRDARSHLLRTAHEEGWPSAALYDALTAPLQSPFAVPGALVHGPVSLVTHADGSSETHIGLAPPRTPPRQGGDDA